MVKLYKQSYEGSINCQKKNRTALSYGAARFTHDPHGNPAISLRPVAFRPHLTAGLALS